MCKYALAALLAGAVATPAFAQDRPPDPSAPSFEGFRIEGLVGWDHAEILDNDGGGLLYGIGAGYDFQTGRAVIGIEGEASESTNGGCTRDFFATGDSFCIDMSRDLYIGGRAGVIVGRNILLFGKAGYTNARVRSEYDDGTPAGTNNFTFSENLDGVRVGLGAQFGIGRNAYFRTEARYSNYEGGSDRGALLGAFGFRF